MNRRKKGKNRKLFKKESRSNYKLGCIITIIILIPILYGVYLYCQGIDTSQKEKPQTSTSFQTSSDQKPENKKPEGKKTKGTKSENNKSGGKNPTTKELEIPVSLTRRQEQIIHHTGYTVSYNKDLKLPNWVSYELTRKETKGKEKRSSMDNLILSSATVGIVISLLAYEIGLAAQRKWKLAVLNPLLISIALVIVFLVFFLKTRLGLAIRATGNNSDMVKSSSINPVFTTVIGLCVANAFTALSGCLLSQSQKSVDINIGQGMVTIALASLLIGGTLLGHGGIFVRAVGMVLGSFIFRLVYTIALRFNMPAFMLKLVSSVIVVLAISGPYLKKQWPQIRRRMTHTKGGR